MLGLAHGHTPPAPHRRRDQRAQTLEHADKHGFLAIPPGEEAGLLDAARFMDTNECVTTIAAARESTGRTPEQACDAIDLAYAAFRAATKKHFSR